jgi:hypothetical protein
MAKEIPLLEKELEVLEDQYSKDFKLLVNFVSKNINVNKLECTSFDIASGYSSYSYSKNHKAIKIIIKNKITFCADLMVFDVYFTKKDDKKEIKINYSYSHGSGGCNTGDEDSDGVKITELDCLKARGNAYDICIKLIEYLESNLLKYTELSNVVSDSCKLKHNKIMEINNLAREIGEIKLNKLFSDVTTLLCVPSDYVEKVVFDFKNDSDSSYKSIKFVSFSRRNGEVSFIENEIFLENYNKKSIKLNDSRIAQKNLKKELENFMIVDLGKGVIEEISDLTIFYFKIKGSSNKRYSEAQDIKYFRDKLKPYILAKEF